MTRLRYRIYYDFETMYRGDFLHEKLSDDDVVENIQNRLPFEFSVMLNDEDAKISVSPNDNGDYILSIETDIEEVEVLRHLKRAVSGLSLFGERL